MSIIKFINKITGTDKELSELELKAKELESKLEEDEKYSQQLQEIIKDQESEINNIKGQGVFYMPFDLVPSGHKDEIGLQVTRFIKMRGLIPELTYCCVSYCEIANALKIVYKKNTPEEKGIKFNF
jgi:hypothetical protein